MKVDEWMKTLGREKADKKKKTRNRGCRNMRGGGETLTEEGRVEVRQKT